MARGTKQTRREFLRRTTVASAATLAVPYFVPAHVLGGQAGTVPSRNKIGVGMVGTGGIGRGHLGWIGGQDDLQIRAVCDVDAGHLKQGLDAAKNSKNGKDCRRATPTSKNCSPGPISMWCG